MAATMKTRLALLVAVSFALILRLALTQSVVLADGHEDPGSEMNMGDSSPMDDMGTNGMDMSDGPTMDDLATNDIDMSEGAPMDNMVTNEMDMNDGSPMDDMATSGMDMSEGSNMGAMDMSTSKWQDQVNKLSYPVTAVLALLTVVICIMLMRATGLTDKFGLVSAGLALFLVQSIIGVLYYVSDGSIVNMPTLMFVMSLLTSVAMLLIGTAFYRWQRMIS